MEASQETDLQNKMRGHVCPILKKSINGKNTKLICLLCALYRFCCWSSTQADNSNHFIELKEKVTFVLNSGTCFSFFTLIWTSSNFLKIVLLD